MGLHAVCLHAIRRTRFPANALIHCEQQYIALQLLDGTPVRAREQWISQHRPFSRIDVCCPALPLPLPTRLSEDGKNSPSGDMSAISQQALHGSEPAVFATGARGEVGSAQLPLFKGNGAPGRTSVDAGSSSSQTQAQTATTSTRTPTRVARETGASKRVSEREAAKDNGSRKQARLTGS